MVGRWRPPAWRTRMAAAWDGPEGDHWATHAEHYSRRRCGTGAVRRSRTDPDHGLDHRRGLWHRRSTRDLGLIATGGEVLESGSSSRMLERGPRAGSAEGVDNIRFEQGDACAPVRALDRRPRRRASSVRCSSVIRSRRSATSAAASGRAPSSPAHLARAGAQRVAAQAPDRTLARPLVARAAPRPQGHLAWRDADRGASILTESGYNEVVLESVDGGQARPQPRRRVPFISTVGFTQGLLKDLDSDQAEGALGTSESCSTTTRPAACCSGRPPGIVTARVPVCSLSTRSRRPRWSCPIQKVV